jgi:hypothetical protein
LSVVLNLKKNVIDDEDVTITVNMPNTTTNGKTNLTVTANFKVSKSTYPLIWKGLGEAGGAVGNILEHAGGLIGVSSGTLGYKAAKF